MNRSLLIKSAIASALFVAATSFLPTLGRFADSNPVSAGSETEASAMAEKRQLRGLVINPAHIPKVVAAGGDWVRNPLQKDKDVAESDVDALFDEANNQSKQYDECTYSDGTRYAGPGTVLNPYAGTNGCLVLASASAPAPTGDSNALIIAGSDADYSVISGNAPEGGVTTSLMWGGGPRVLATGGGGPGRLATTAVAISGGSNSGTGTNQNGTPDEDDEPHYWPRGNPPTMPTLAADPVPVPGAAVLFISGLGLLGWRKRR